MMMTLYLSLLAVAGFNTPFGLPSAATHAAIASPMSLPPIEHYDAVGLAGLLLVGGVVATFVTSSEVVNHMSEGETSISLPSPVVVNRNVKNTDLEPVAAGRKLWLDNRRLLSFEDLTYGCFKIAKEEIQNG